MNIAPSTRWFLTVAAFVSAVVALNRIVSPFDDSDYYDRDFLQEHLIAQALRAGDDPYAPLPELAAKYLPLQRSLPWKHSCPHPPPALLVFLPIGLLPYQVGKIVWLIIELACLAGFIEMIARWWNQGGVSWWAKGVAFFACLSAGPVMTELWNGQFSMLLLVLLTCAWLRLRANADVTGGLFLGLAIAMKWSAWPIGLFLFLSQRWTAVFVCGVIVLAANVLGAAVLGWDAVVHYYTIIGPGIARDYRQHMENYSFWSIGSRFFSPVPIEGLGGFVTEPIVANLAVEKIVTYVIPVVMLAAALALAWRCRSFDSSFGILLVAGLPINPIVWDHYLLLTLLPIAVCLKRLARVGFTRATVILILVGLAISILLPRAYLEAAVRFFAFPDQDYIAIMPFFPGLVTYLPLVPLSIWIGLLWSTDAEAAAFEKAGANGV